ncbi:unnamed protein product [Rhizopus microsporus]
MGSTIPITFALLPIAPDLQVRPVSCALKEYITSTYDTFSSGPDTQTKTELLSVPNIQSHQIQTDSICDLLKIKHKLKYTISLENTAINLYIPAFIDPSKLLRLSIQDIPVVFDHV